MGPRGAVAPAQEGPQAADCLDPVQARERLTDGERLGRANRLARAADVRHCLSRGRRRRTEHLEMIWAENSTGHPRMGLIVPKYGTSAVARNRLRRQLREIWRRDVLSQSPAWDLIIRARKEAYGQPFAELRRQMVNWRDAVIPAR